MNTNRNDLIADLMRAADIFGSRGIDLMDSHSNPILSELVLGHTEALDREIVRFGQTLRDEAIDANWLDPLAAAEFDALTLGALGALI